MVELEEVFGGCKVCGKRMITDRYPLVYRTCDACKLAQRQAHNRKHAALRKAERHAAKQAMRPPRCQHCGEVIEGAVRLDGDGDWARQFCSNRCRQAAFRARNG
jgi:hypothetical protein